MRDLEKRIESLEAKSAEVLIKLESASVAGEGEAIGDHSRLHEELTRDINAAFERLDRATKVYEEAAREFDERLGDIG